MAYDISNQPEIGGLAWDGLKKSIVQKVEVDFSIAANNLAQNKVMAVMRIPAGVLIEEIMLNVKTADADISDVDVGIATASTEATISADGFINNADISTTGLKRDLAGETYSRQDGTAGYFTSVETDIIITNKDAQTIDEAVIDVIAVLKDLN